LYKYAGFADGGPPASDTARDKKTRSVKNNKTSDVFLERFLMSSP
jgi:hypothetical protein